MATLQRQQPDYFRLQWDLYRLTSDDPAHGYEVLSAILLLTVSQGRREAEIAIGELFSAVQYLRDRDARIYGAPIPERLPEDAITEALHELAFRRVISFTSSDSYTGAAGSETERWVVLTPLIKTWKDLPSVRLDVDGQPVRITL